MKTIFLFVALSAFSTASQAQTLAEWFRQKATQKKYLLQQIAANKMYIDYLKKGYKIAKDGLNAISDWKRGEFNLHSNYFNSLKTVNPKIKNHTRVAQLVDLQIKIVKEFQKSISQIKRSDVFRADEISYITKVSDRVLNDSEQILDDLISLITNYQLEMKDDQRIARMDQLYEQMQSNYAFTKYFINDVKLLARSRLREMKDGKNK